MEFRHLNASISNNADQSPSLYMALCMVESLFLDIEDQCGEDFSLCPIGDERLPTKLVWLARNIQDIYKNKNEELQRNRPRLDTAMEKLKTTRQSLDEFAAVSEQLTALKKENTDLEKKLQTQKSLAGECETLNKRIVQTRQELDALRKFDPSTAKKELDSLNREITTLKAHQAQLNDDLGKKKELKNKLQGEVNQLSQECSRLSSGIELTEKHKAEQQQKKEELVADLAAQRTKQAELCKENADLARKCDEVKQEIADLQQTVDQFQKQKLDTALEAKKNIQAQLAALQEQQESITKESSELQAQLNRLVLDIGNQRSQNETLNRDIGDNSEKLEDLRASQDQLKTTLSGQIHLLQKRRSDVEQLEGSKREAEQQLIDEKACYDKLTQELDEANAQCSAYTQEIQSLTERLPELKKKLENTRVDYDNLTVQFTANSEEIKALEQKVAELKKQNGEEKYMVYRTQLEKTRQALTDLQNECSKLKADIDEAEQQLQKETERRDDLQNRVSCCKQVKAEVEKSSRELAFASTSTYLKELESMEERLNFLAAVRGDLVSSLKKMHQILTHNPDMDNLPLESLVGAELQELCSYTNALRKSLLECANNIKMEEQ